MLRAIQQLLKERGTMSLKGLAIHFDTDAEALEAMLEQLIEKDRVRKAGAICDSCPKRCADCSEARTAAAVFYELC